MTFDMLTCDKRQDKNNRRVNVAVGVNFHQHRCHPGSHHVMHRHWLVQNSAILLKIHQNVYQGKLLIYINIHNILNISS